MLTALFIIVLFVSLPAYASVSVYDVCWTSQSHNSSESMPCGGGDIGTNVWVEKDEVFLYLSRSGAFDENNNFLKFGRVRIKMTPNPFENASFTQTLNLKKGCVEIVSVKNGNKTQMNIWVDVFHPTVYVDLFSDTKIEMCVTYENWRNKGYEWKTNQLMGNIAFRNSPYLPFVHPDVIVPQERGVLWYHRNEQETFFDKTIAMQHLGHLKDSLWNPLSNLTFGGYIEGDGLVYVGDTIGKYVDTEYKGYVLRSTSRKKTHQIAISLHVEQTETLDEWFAGLDKIRRYTKDKVNNRKKTIEWWQNFWQKSYVRIDYDNKEHSVPFQIGRNYQLFRYQLACNAFGEYPTKFNGGLFTYDPSFVDPNYKFDPDYRNWGGGTHTAQNQRLVYWPMLKNGDFELMEPQFKFYLRALKNAELRTKEYWQHKGASFTEQIEQFGLPIAYCYGWNRSPLLEKGYQQNLWVEHLWDTSLEFCMMILETNRYANIDISQYMPLIKSCLIFFDEHYQYEALKRGSKPLDANGHLIMYPGSGAETYKLAYNSTSTIAALKSVLNGLLNLQSSYLFEDERKYFEGLLSRIPPISYRMMNGHQTIAPAVAFARIQNGEIPQLYPVFPWGLFGIGLPDLDVAINTWRYGVENEEQKNYVSWHQDAIFCARLGLTEEAKQITIKKMQNSDKRFPTFWGPGHDWTPDHNWGGSGMIGVQEMLLQTVGKDIYLFPAWPQDWNVDFKLYAPYNTIIECEYYNGKIVKLEVFPKERLNDVKVMLNR